MPKRSIWSPFSNGRQPGVKIWLIGMILFTVVHGQETEKETFDPNTLNDPEPNWPVFMNSMFEETSPGREESMEDIIQEIIEGYRVQILATRYADKADSLREEIRRTVSTEVYITFEAPNYKVRVGNCLDRKSAEVIQDQLKSMGYSSAWIIRTRVEPRINPVQDP